MRTGVAALLAGLALAAPAARAVDDDAVIVIRGADVSVARPLTVERAEDGATEVEIVRVETATPEPPPPAREPDPEPQVVVVYVPVVEPTPVGIPIGWWPLHQRHFDRHRHFPTRPQPLGLRPAAQRRVLRGR